MSFGPRVLFVSKPIVAPWRDGSKTLVRDVARHLSRAVPTVMTVPTAPSLGERVQAEGVYRDAGGYAPSLVDNGRVMRRLLTGDPQDVWAFVFAPNAMSSSAASVALRTRRALGWRGASVQIIPSAPRSFDGVARWIFGDFVVALSEWTRGRLVGAGIDARGLRVIPPCATPPRPVTDEERRAFRARHELGDGPIVLYPGDYEVSQGARVVARAIPLLARQLPDARVVFACRAKTKDAAPARAVIERAVAKAGLTERTRHLGEVDDMATLLAVADVIAFPVDDLYGKVDVPIVLLEALAVGTPMVLVKGGPLEAITTARFVDPGDDRALATELLRVLTDEAAAREQRARGKELFAERFSPEAVARQYDELFATAAGMPANT